DSVNPDRSILKSSNGETVSIKWNVTQRCLQVDGFTGAYVATTNRRESSSGRIRTERRQNESNSGGGSTWRARVGDCFGNCPGKNAREQHRQTHNSFTRTIRPFLSLVLTTRLIGLFRCGHKSKSC